MTNINSFIHYKIYFICTCKHRYSFPKTKPNTVNPSLLVSLNVETVKGTVSLLACFRYCVYNNIGNLLI